MADDSGPTDSMSAPSWARAAAPEARRREVAVHERAVVLHERAAALQQRCGYEAKAWAARQRARHAQERHDLALKKEHRISGLELTAAALTSEIATFLDQVLADERNGTRLNRLLLGFLEDEVLPQAMRAAELGMDPTPSLEVIAGVLSMYAAALEPPGPSTD